MLLPSEDDLKGAVSSLNRLQDVYQLNISEVADGYLLGFPSPVLTMEDCHLLGKLSYDSHDFHHATMWHNVALRRINAADENNKNKDLTNKDTKVERSKVPQEYLDKYRLQIIDTLIQSYYALTNYTKVLPLLDEAIRRFPADPKYKQNRNHVMELVKDKDKYGKKQTMDTLPEFHMHRYGYQAYDNFLTFAELCR